MPVSYAFYQVNAFTTEAFKGNPAAVCLLDEWPGNHTLQNIAADNNLSETAFLKPVDEDYEIRWFTPSTEVALCGHGTLASAFVVFEYVHPEWDEVIFHTRFSGDLFLARNGEQLIMELPKVPIEERVNTHGLDQFNVPVKKVYEGDKLILVLESEEAVRDFQPYQGLISEMHEFGVAITALSDDPEIDFVSRFFAPNAGINEDPVTGSLHCALAELWEHSLQKDEMKARQVSYRGGDIDIVMKGERVVLKGYSRKVIDGHFYL